MSQVFWHSPLVVLLKMLQPISFCKCFNFCFFFSWEQLFTSTFVGSSTLREANQHLEGHAETSPSMKNLRLLLCRQTVSLLSRVKDSQKNCLSQAREQVSCHTCPCRPSLKCPAPCSCRHWLACATATVTWQRRSCSLLYWRHVLSKIHGHFILQLSFTCAWIPLHGY